MNDLLGIVNNTKEARDLNSIIKKRSLATIPFGGRYRLIDFHLSNMVNSGIYNISILVKKNYRSLMGHIRSPKEWGLDIKKDGIFVLPPDREGQEWRNLRGDLQILEGNLDYLTRSSQNYVLIVNANIICNIDYLEALDHHKESDNDITVIYKKISKGEVYSIEDYTQISLDDDEKLKTIERNEKSLKTNTISLEMYIMKKSLLQDMINTCTSKGEYDFLKDGIINKFYKYNMGGFEYDGEFMNINSINSYYKNSMRLLDSHIREDIFSRSGKIYTSVKDSPPAKYGKKARVLNSLVANGTRINGEIQDSIVFRDVQIGNNTTIKNSIIMQGTVIGENVELENVIIDKDCSISANRRLIGSVDYPVVMEKKTDI